MVYHLLLIKNITQLIHNSENYTNTLNLIMFLTLYYLYQSIY